MLTAQNRCVFGLAEPRTMSNRQGVEGQQQIIQQRIVSWEVRWPLGLWRLCKMCFFPMNVMRYQRYKQRWKTYNFTTRFFAWKLNFLWPKEVYSKMWSLRNHESGGVVSPNSWQVDWKMGRLKSGGEIRGDFKIRLRCSFPVAYDGRCVV